MGGRLRRQEGLCPNVPPKYAPGHHYRCDVTPNTDARGTDLRVDNTGQRGSGEQAGRLLSDNTTHMCNSRETLFSLSFLTSYFFFTVSLTLLESGQAQHNDANARLFPIRHRSRVSQSRSYDVIPGPSPLTSQ